ncbi:MAG: hypothetical protein C0481_02355 [Phenylobacterium sp.]|uniref:hypothetical protein n=1 Tax=Phenylobacterium sp. TaxID=1871053 RepID=UPI0026012842|nr:hypothetical protein [Phenylobacterium sp.]MBA4010686.1 hypothetical protein [Phenylobacterium sp.]
MIRFGSFARRARRRLRGLVGSVLNRPAIQSESTKAQQAFDPLFYLKTNVDVAEAGVDPFVHYFETGWREGRRPNRYFDPRYYLETYPDVAEAGLEPFAHYIAHGASEGRNPSEAFDTLWYLTRHPDVAESGLNPLLHFLAFGEAEGREIGPRTAAEEEEELAGAPADIADHGLAAAEACPLRDPHGPSLATAASAAETVRRFATTEFDLMRLQSQDLTALPIVRPTQGGLPIAWEKLYLEMHGRPSRIILCGSFANSPAAGRIARATAELHGADSLFVLATDEAAPRPPEGLPRGVRWRSLAEFGADLGSFDRSALVTALLHCVQPEAVMVVDSLAGWESMYLRGAPLSKMMRLYGVLGAGTSTDAHSGRVFRRCFPSMSAFYSEDERQLRSLADRFGVPASAYGRLRSLPAPAKALHRRPGEIVSADTFDVEGESWRLFLKALSADGGFLAAGSGRDGGAQ